jgi:hypothetical protein
MHGVQCCKETGLRTEQAGFRIPEGEKDFPYSKSKTSSGPHPISGDSFSGVMWTGREVDHLSPSSAEVKNEWSDSCTPPISFHGV